MERDHGAKLYKMCTNLRHILWFKKCPLYFHMRIFMHHDNGTFKQVFQELSISSAIQRNKCFRHCHFDFPEFNKVSVAVCDRL